jgi:dUTP pyrophosphatase
MKIKLDKGAKMPIRVHRQDAGLDLHSMEMATIFPGESWTFDTGVHIALEPGTYGKIESKSGLNVKHDIVSCGGVVDEGFTGSIRVKLYNLGHEAYTFYPGDKIAQLVIMPYLVPEMEVVDDLEDTDRGANGFGSSGK